MQVINVGDAQIRIRNYSTLTASRIGQEMVSKLHASSKACPFIITENITENLKYSFDT